jgi:hypothetical protein
MRIPSGVTDQYIYLYAVDSTDLVTPETGLTSFTVYRSRNGAAAVAYTTPTVTEVSAANMPGWYTLLLDEDMTIGSGNDSEEVALHITQASMAPVRLTFELYRREVTAGETITVSGGIGDADVQQVSGSSVPATNLARLLNATGVALTADSGTTTTLTDAALTQSDVDYWKGSTVYIWSGANAGLSRVVTAFDPTTDTLTFEPALPAAVSTVAYVLGPFGAFLGGTSIRAAMGLASANLDTQLTAIDDYLDTEIAAILADTNELQTDLANGGRLDLLIDAIKAKTDALPTDPADQSALEALIAALPTATENAAELLDIAAGVETGLTVRQAMRLMAAVLFGKASGMSSTTAVFRDFGDTKDRITATVDSDGNRTAISRDAT